jgi:hypothetical protein
LRDLIGQRLMNELDDTSGIFGFSIGEIGEST